MDAWPQALQRLQSVDLLGNPNREQYGTCARTTPDTVSVRTPYGDSRKRSERGVMLGRPLVWILIRKHKYDYFLKIVVLTPAYCSKKKETPRSPSHSQPRRSSLRILS